MSQWLEEEMKMLTRSQLPVVEAFCLASNYLVIEIELAWFKSKVSGVYIVEVLDGIFAV